MRIHTCVYVCMCVLRYIYIYIYGHSSQHLPQPEASKNEGRERSSAENTFQNRKGQCAHDVCENGTEEFSAICVRAPVACVPVIGEACARVPALSIRPPFRFAVLPVNFLFVSLFLQHHRPPLSCNPICVPWRVQPRQPRLGCVLLYLFWHAHISCFPSAFTRRCFLCASLFKLQVVVEPSREPWLPTSHPPPFLSRPSPLGSCKPESPLLPVSVFLRPHANANKKSHIL